VSPVVEVAVVLPATVFAAPIVAVVEVVGDVVLVVGFVVAVGLPLLSPSSSSPPKQPAVRSPNPMAVMETSAFFILKTSRNSLIRDQSKS
jgi:hypothetical protein